MKTKASPTSLLLFQQQPAGGVDEGYNGESGDYWWMTCYIFYKKIKKKKIGVYKCQVHKVTKFIMRTHYIYLTKRTKM